MAIISGDQNDYFGSQEISLSAIQYLNVNYENQKEILSSNYNNLGKVAHHLKRYAEADHFYIQSIDLANKEKSRVIYISNLAINLSDQKRYSEALSYFEKIIKNKSLTNDSNSFPRVLTNMSLTKWRQNPNYNPVANFLKALHIREKINDQWGQNSSYAHLADYYIQKQSDSALFYANKMYHVAKEIKSADDQLEALQKLIKLSPPKETKHFFNVYEKLNDSVQIARNAAKNQFALIRYDTEKSKADNLVLQKDNEGKRYQIIILIIGILLLIIVGTLWYKKRKQRLELEAQNTIRDNKLKTSQKVHDVVANGLYRIMSKLDNQETLKDNPIVNEIEELYEQSRDLSYEKPKSKDQNFHEKIFNLLKSFASENTRVILVGNSAPLWEKVSEKAKDEIEHILQELMVNMGKHSQASDVVIKFEQAEQKINIYYTDNGIGIAGKPQPKNGLTNTGNRIDAIGGTITFDTKVEKGLKIQISFPVS
ncbi:tetratricopeptide repeat protein [Pedobacter sp. MR2016-19]|nr:tetratricopeptide repeat protein [Pedobacter sp. MR2016-19]